MVNVALIGIGYWGQKLKRYIEESPDFNLKCACDSKSDLGSVWFDENVDAVVIATPNETHYPLARSALLNGKHVLVEKPPAMDSEGCKLLRSIADKKRLVLMTDYNYTFSESLRKAGGLVRQIGRVFAMDITMKRIDRFTDRDAYWVLGSHAMSILDMFVPLYLLRFRKLDMIRENGRVRSGALAFGDSGIAGRILVDLKGRKKTEVLIYGQRGMITYNPARYKSLVVVSDKNMEFHFDESNNLRYMLTHFHKAIEGKEQDNSDVALNISKILEELGCPK